MTFKIYTRVGDSGNTSLFGGLKVSKDDIRVEAYGTIDELNAHIGLLSDLLEFDEIKANLNRVQNVLFNIGSHLAAVEQVKDKLPTIDTRLEGDLERLIDDMEQELSPLKNFILPGGHSTVSQCHIVRTVSRRAERRIVSAKDLLYGEENILKIINRLSDYFFVLARYLSKKYGVTEVLWSK